MGKGEAVLTFLVWILVGCLLTVYAVVIVFPATQQDGEVIRINLLVALANSIVLPLAGTCLVAGIASAIVRFRAAYPLIWIAVAIPVPYIISFVRLPDPYQITSSLTSKEGRRYFLLQSSFLQGCSAAITQRMPSNAFEARYQVLVAGSGAWDAPGLLVVRPMGAKQEDGLILDRKGRVVAIQESEAFLAYDPASKQGFSDRDQGSKAITLLSPFVLLGPKDKLTDEDVAALFRPGFGRPNVEAVTPDVPQSQPGSQCPRGKTLDQSEVKPLILQGRTLLSSPAQRFGTRTVFEPKEPCKSFA